MSMAVTTFYCTHCDYHQGDTHTWGARVYVLPNGNSLNIPRRLGWCEDCGGLASVEEFSAEDIGKDIRNAELELANMPPQPFRKWWQLWKFLPFNGWDTTVGRWNFNRKDTLDRIADLRAMQSIVEKRRNPPLCLECGSARVIAPIVKNRDFWEAKKPISTGFIHPDCGGEIWCDEDGLRIALTPYIRRYTPEGEFIGRVDDVRD